MSRGQGAAGCRRGQRGLGRGCSELGWYRGEGARGGFFQCLPPPRAGQQLHLSLPALRS